MCKSVPDCSGRVVSRRLFCHGGTSSHHQELLFNCSHRDQELPMLVLFSNHTATQVGNYTRKLSAVPVSGSPRVEKAVGTFKKMQGRWGMLCALTVLTSGLLYPCTGSTLHSHMAPLFALTERLDLSSPTHGLGVLQNSPKTSPFPFENHFEFWKLAVTWVLAMLYEIFKARGVYTPPKGLG